MDTTEQKELIYDIRRLMLNRKELITWTARLLGVCSLASLCYLIGWEVTVAMAFYHVAHVIGRHDALK